MANMLKTYDIIDLVNGKPEIGRICTIDLFQKDMGANAPHHTFIGDPKGVATAIYVKKELDIVLSK
jgi:hypothetical protein